MELAKQFIDVGLFTNQLDQMREFYGERIKLPYESMLPLGGGLRQYRYGMLGSVLKINHARDPLPARRLGGYQRLTISDRRVIAPFVFADPDGNQVTLVPSGQRGIGQIEVHLGVTDEAAFVKFYGEVLGAEQIGSENRFRIGESIVSFATDAAAVKFDGSGPMTAMEAIATMRAVGLGYITIQVRDCDAAHRAAPAKGAWEGSAPMTLGDVARLSFIRDPDGNFIELSQRAAEGEALPKG
ncbi:MAG TPA: VOC family protein [Candidatus Binataceae bacterium]|nr:VOC family protein [Candidatus Binataceae bacterium]